MNLTYIIVLIYLYSKEIIKEELSVNAYSSPYDDLIELNMHGEDDYNIFSKLEGTRKSNGTTSKSCSCMPCSFRIFESSFTKVIRICMNNERSSNHGGRTFKSNKVILQFKNSFLSLDCIDIS